MVRKKEFLQKEHGSCKKSGSFPTVPPKRNNSPACRPKMSKKETLLPLRRPIALASRLLSSCLHLLLSYPSGSLVGCYVTLSNAPTSLPLLLCRCAPLISLFGIALTSAPTTLPRLLLHLHPALPPLVTPLHPSFSSISCCIKLAGALASLPLLLRFVIIVSIVVFANRHNVAVRQQQQYNGNCCPTPPPLVAPSRPSCSLVGCCIKLAGP
jgi:hypothetical protein